MPTAKKTISHSCSTSQKTYNCRKKHPFLMYFYWTFTASRVDEVKRQRRSLPHGNPAAVSDTLDKKTSIIRKTKFFPNSEYQIRRQGFLEAGCDGTRSAPSALHSVPRCLQSALSRRPKLCFGPEK